MVRIFVFFLIYVMSLLGFAQSNEASLVKNLNKPLYKIDVVVNNVISDKGKIYFALYDSETNFNSKNSIQTAEATVSGGFATVSFTELISNTYAIICFHDANDNGKMDFQENGMPLEDYGATNNVMNYGPPQFNDAKFELIDKDLTFEIKF